MSIFRNCFLNFKRSWPISKKSFFTFIYIVGISIGLAIGFAFIIAIVSENFLTEKAYFITLVGFFIAALSVLRFTFTWSKLDNLLKSTYGIYEYIDSACEFYTDCNMDLVAVHVKRWKKYDPLKRALMHSRARQIFLFGDISLNQYLGGVIWRILLVRKANKARCKKGLPPIQISHFAQSDYYPGFVLTIPDPDCEPKVREDKSELLVSNPHPDSEELYAHSFKQQKKYAEVHNGMFFNEILPHLSPAENQIVDCWSKLPRVSSIDNLRDEIIKKCYSNAPLMRKERFFFSRDLNKYLKFFKKRKVINITPREGTSFTGTDWSFFNLKYLLELLKKLKVIKLAQPQDLICFDDEKLYSSPPSLKGLSFTESEKAKAISDKRLCRITIEFSRKCNLKCIYCYANAGNPLPDEMPVCQIKEIIDQAVELGAKTISLVGGGEPLLYPHWKTVVNHIYKKGLNTILFTNGIGMNETIADYLYKRQVSIITKLNSFDKRVQNELNGLNGDYNSFDVMMRSIDLLIERGFNKGEPTRLAVESVVCKKNLDEIHKLWRWLRNRNIFPYIELVKLQGRGKINKEVLGVTKDEAKALFEKLLEIDRKYYGYSWIPSPPFPAFKCNLYYYNAYVDCQGNVQPCVGVEERIGNVKNESLATILAKPRFDTIRNINKNLKGKCRTCDINGSCYGCRGHVFNTTGDLLESDDMCWRC